MMTRKMSNILKFFNVKKVFWWINDNWRNNIIGRYRGAGVLGLYHWVRCHTWDRYHIIDIGKSNPHYYNWGWVDRDHAMMAACFQLLTDFVDKEKPFDVIDWESDSGHRKAGKEIKELYEWWTSERFWEHQELDGMHVKVPDLDNADTSIWDDSWNEWCAFSDELDEKDDLMLKRLMKIRKYLWT